MTIERYSDWTRENCQQSHPVGRSYLAPLMASVRSEMANPTLAFRLVDEYSDVEVHVSARGLSAALGAVEAEGDENHPNYWEFEALRKLVAGAIEHNSQFEVHPDHWRKVSVMVGGRETGEGCARKAWSGRWRQPKRTSNAQRPTPNVQCNARCSIVWPSVLRRDLWCLLVQKTRIGEVVVRKDTNPQEAASLFPECGRSTVCRDSPAQERVRSIFMAGPSTVPGRGRGPCGQRDVPAFGTPGIAAHGAPPTFKNPPRRAPDTDLESRQAPSEGFSPRRLDTTRLPNYHRRSLGRPFPSVMEIFPR